MKKRTLVCFLIFTLCVFYTSIPNTVFGQEASLAQQVFDKHSETLLREDVKVLLPEILGGLKDSPLPIPNLIDTALGLIAAGQGAALQGIAAGQGIELTDEHIALLEDPDVQTVLNDDTTKALLSLTGAELGVALDEFAGLLGVGAEPPVDTTPPVVEPPVVEPPVDTTPPVVEPPVDTTPPVVEPPVVEPPVDTTPPVVEPPVVEPPSAETLPPADPVAPIMPENQPLFGTSRLGGLSLNTTSGRRFVEGIARELGLPGGAEALVDSILSFVPKGILPKKQIKQLLTSTRQSIAFATNQAGLDAENFGNAITPNFAEYAYSDPQSGRYLTSDSLHLYTRVPSANIGGVTFNLGGRTVEGTQVTSEEFQADTIPYTFRLDEALAATNLPAWPSLEIGLFSDVVLRYSQTGPEGTYNSHRMHAKHGKNGVVWETEIGINLGQIVYYYFEVTLAEPVEFKTLSREKLAAIAQDPENVSLAAIMNATTTLRIESWAMPDPRNLQLTDRGIGKKIITDDIRAEILNILGSPRGSAILSQVLSGQLPSVSDVLRAMTPKQRNRLQNMFLRNTNKLMTAFEASFDPLLASVFRVPRINPETESIWAARIDNIADGNYNLEALVHGADGTPVDQIIETFTVDTSAPEADIGITPADTNTTGYLNSEGIYVATAHNGPVLLQVTGMPKSAYAGQGVGPGEGYLFYQQVGLDAHGMPTSTWMPLTVENTMLSNGIWRALLENEQSADGMVQAIKQLPQVAGGLDDASILTLLKANTPKGHLDTLIALGAIENAANSFFRNFGWKNFKLSDAHAAILNQVLGASIDIVDHLVPVTFRTGQHMTMIVPQGLYGEYGIRAMGIDTLFNVGSYAEPTRLRVVMPEADKASVTAAIIGDCNLDGDMDDLFESGPVGDVTIFKNTTENVMLTVTVDHRSQHPATVMVQYMDASGMWQSIGELDLAGTQTGSTLQIGWNVADFDALAAAGNQVMVRAVASNALSITDPEPMEGAINLDTGICPLDPEVVAITMDAPMVTNPDSGAPQGTITLNAYTPSRTSMPIGSVRLAATGPQETEWVVESSAAVDHIEGQELADILGDLVNTVGPDKPIVHVNSTYQKWTVSVDTTTLADTITADSPAARDATKDENQYVVTGYANTGGAEVPPIPGVQTMFSVDNVDDVAPLGPTNVTVKGVEGVDSTFETAEDGNYTVGGLVDKYDDEVASPVATLTIEPTAARSTYKSVRVLTDAEGIVIGDATETAEGSGVFEVTVDVGTLADGATYLQNGTYMFHALASDEFGNEQADMSETDGSKITVTVENTYRPAPGVLAITVDPAAETNPDSGAPQGTITLNSYSLGERTSPPITSMRFEVKRQDADDTEWKEVGTTAEGTVIAEEESQALQQDMDFLTDLVYAAAETVAAGAESSPIHRQGYQKWSVDIDTVALELEDTITAESDAARDVSLDTNLYVVRAIAVSAANESEAASGAGVKSTFSLDNVDDVAPLGPTNIVAVADVAGAIEADADGNYTVGGIVDETVPSPIATYTAEPTADPKTYDSIQLVQVDADGNETLIDGEAGMLDVTTDVGVLANGPYMIHALAVDEFGNIQTDESPQITVNVLNFRVEDVRQLKVTAVDGVDVPRTPTEPIPLRGSLTVGFDVDNGSLDAEELSGSVDGSEVPSESEENPENSFSLMVDVSGLADGMYTPNAVVTKRNGSVSVPLLSINLDNTGPMVEIQTPSEDHTVSSLPTVHATYNDGEGSGTDSNGQEVLAWATTELTAGPTVGIARVHPEAGDVDVAIDQEAIETDNGTLVYTRTDKLGGGAYRVTVRVADVLGNVGEASREFAIGGTPADTTAPVITEAAPSGTISGESWVTISAVVNDAESKVISVKFGVNDQPLRSIAPAQIADGRVQIADSFTAGTHTVKVIAISEGGKREHSWTFTLVVDNVAPIITSITPTGTIRAGLPVISASANDASGVDDMDIVLMDSNGKEVKGDTEDDGEDDVEGITRLDFMPEKPLDEGTYTISVRATDTIGNSATAKGSFTIDFDTAAPVITMSSPQNEARLTERRPQISITYADAESGVDADSIRFVLDDRLINLKPNQKSASQVLYTPDVDLAFGQHTVKLEVSDMAHKEGNVSEKSSGAREANMAVHEFTFFVESEEGPVLASRPINAPNPFKDNTRISFTLTRQSTVSIVIYDMTLRPVRVLVDNEVWDAGEYVGKGAIGWDGTSTAGEDLARGVYFCQIMVADGFEPEYAILKLALTR